MCSTKVRGMSDLDTVEETIIDENEPAKEEAPESIADAIDSTTGVPSWAEVPDNLKIPPGRTVFYMRFRAKWTSTPHKGDRHCIMWTLSDNEENTVIERSKGHTQRFIKEAAKMMIRSVDGVKSNWTGTGEGDVRVFWEEIGPKCRQQLQSLYMRTHTLAGADMMDFLGNCVSASTAQPL